MPALVAELLPLEGVRNLGCERTVGDHDRKALRLRLDLQEDAAGLEPAMAVWLAR
jgi:hypothetical protein